YIPDPGRVVIAQRTILERDVYPICSIPAGTRVLVVNDNLETTQEMASLLYKLEINNLKLVIYEDGVEYPDIRIAITPGESWRVPTSISTVIDIGHRYVDISTLVKIVDMLKLNEAEVSRRILKYSETLVDLDSGIKTQYRELFRKNQELDTVVNLSHEGILLLNTEGVISLCNKSLTEMLELRKDVRGFPVRDILPQGMLAVMAQDWVEDEVFEFNGKSLIINKRNTEHFGETAGTYYNFQEVTYIKQLEQNLSRKLRQKGLLARYTFSDIHTRSPQMRQCADLACRIAGSDLTVLITGESGTGKELLAQSIHNASLRAKQPFVAFNCAAVVESLMESELFGYEGGSFTGALKDGKEGLFEQANHGTVLLDEIGDMPLSLQVKLLRVLQERQIMRVGSQRVTNVDIRVIAATNHDLRQRIQAGSFREDLYYRLNVLPLRVPPLRERVGDALYLLDRFLKQNGKQDLEISAEVREVLIRHQWPGNIRELANVGSYISFMAQDVVTAAQLPYYLVDDQGDFNADYEEMGKRCERDKAVTLLETLDDLAEKKPGAGRNSLRDALAESNTRLTEGEVRRLLTILNGGGFITSRVGRRGSEITTKGKAFLRWVHDR
ncbi:MAG: sigma 54-interacting transcriptional regulator, partial [Treponemataceae bacterium]